MKQSVEYKLLKGLAKGNRHVFYLVVDKALDKAETREEKDAILDVNDRMVRSLGFPEMEHRHLTHRR